MALQKREKILVWIVAILVAGVSLSLAISVLRGPGGNLKEEKDKVQAELDRQQNRIAIAGRDTKLLEAWRDQSLPSDVETAQGLYDSWLRKAATEANLSEARITCVNVKEVDDAYVSLRFRIRAKTTIKGLTKFLHTFYGAPLLQKIVLLSINPDDKGKSLGVQITIEALSLPKATAKDELPKGESKQKLESYEVYRKKIVDRNVFGVYVKPPPEKPPVKPPEPPKKVDPLEFTELNSIVADGGRWKVWLNAKMTGEPYKLSEGEEAEIGESKCKVLRIGRRDADFEIDGKRFRVSLGQNLREGEPLDEEKK